MCADWSALNYPANASFYRTGITNIWTHRNTWSSVGIKLTEVYCNNTISIMITIIIIKIVSPLLWCQHHDVIMRHNVGGGFGLIMTTSYSLCAPEFECTSVFVFSSHRSMATAGGIKPATEKVARYRAAISHDDEQVLEVRNTS